MLCKRLLVKVRGYGGNLIRIVYIECLLFKSIGSVKKFSDFS